MIYFLPSVCTRMYLQFCMSFFRSTGENDIQKMREGRAEVTEKKFWMLQALQPSPWYIGVICAIESEKGYTVAASNGVCRRNGDRSAKNYAYDRATRAQLCELYPTYRLKPSQLRLWRRRAFPWVKFQRVSAILIQAATHRHWSGGRAISSKTKWQQPAQDETK